MVNYQKLTPQGITLAKKFVSHTPKYGKQISLPVGFTFNTLLSELIKPVGTRQIEFFEVMFDGKTAGFCYYTIYERCRTAEIATIFLPKYRGKNLSFPTISFLIKHAIRYYPELLRMEATESSSNAIAISILLSAGFKIEGVRPNGYVCGKMISDAILFGMLLGKDRNTVSSLYRFDSFKNRKKEKARLIRQGNILLKHETQLMQDVGIFDKFAHAKQIIDIGCGFGQFALWLSKKFPTVNKIIGVDPSEYMIQESEAKGRRKVSMVCSDGLKFLERLPRGKTDIVCLRFVINHIPSHLWNRWLIAVKRCLKPGGIIYLTLADANYYKTSPKLPLMDIMFKHKKLLREKNGGIWNVPSVIGGHLHTAGYNRITQQSVCLNTKDMGSHNYAVSIGDQFIWGIEDNWKKTGELTKRLLLDASKQDDFWGQVKIGIHVGEKQ